MDASPSPDATPDGTPDRTRRRAVRSAMWPATGLAALVAVAAGAGLLTRPPGPGQEAPAPLRAASVAFSGFSGCDQLLAYYRRHAAPLVGPYGLQTSDLRRDGVGVAGSAAGAAEDSARAVAGAVPGPPPPAAAQRGATAPTAPTAPTVNGTNVQVAGVDEGDLAKRVGDLVLVLRPSDDGSLTTLQVLRTDGPRASSIGRLQLRGLSGGQLLVDGDTVLVVGMVLSDRGRPELTGTPDTGTSRLMPNWAPEERSRLVQVDLSRPDRPRFVRTLDLDGSIVGARSVDGVARLAVRSGSPRLPFLAPRNGDPASVREATAANRRVLQRATPDDWLPGYTLTEPGGARSTGRLVDCADVAAPADFSGLDTLALVDFDLRAGEGIGRWERAGVVATGSTVYATAERTYVATSPWQDPRVLTAVPQADGGPWTELPPDAVARVPARAPGRTFVHAFATGRGAPPRYLATGEVEGTLLNQFAMDEHDGRLRVATTTEPVWGPRGGPADSAVDAVPQSAENWGRAPARTPARPVRRESFVTVLEPSGDRLVRVGRVGGLGPEESIRSVRFLGPVGYVVTFRQTDPLYVVDLSDPKAPRVAGELKIPGYSAYLHPVGPGLVLGVGRDGTQSGQVLGLQMSLFDVSDPARPRRVSQVALPGSWSDAEGDHHAFTFAEGLALLPFGGETVVTADGAVVGDKAAADPAAPDTADAKARAVTAGVVAVRLQGGRLGRPAVLVTGRTTAARVQGAPRAAIAPAFTDVPLRIFVDGGHVRTATTEGLAVHRTETLRRVGFTRY